MNETAKLTAAEVQETIEGAGQITIAALCEEFGVHQDTVRSRLKELRKDGVRIVHDQNGLAIMDHVGSNADGQLVRTYQNWLIKVMKATARQGKITRPLVSEAKKQLKELTTPAERRLMIAQSQSLVRILDYIAIEDEMDEG